MIEREITMVVDLYQEIEWILEIILRMFYAKQKGFDQYARNIVGLII